MAQIDPNAVQWDAAPQTVGEAPTGSPDRPLRGGVIIPAAPEKPKEPPSGYRWTQGGGLEPIPGGPATPKPEAAPEQAPYSQSALDAFDRAIAQTAFDCPSFVRQITASIAAN